MSSSLPPRTAPASVPPLPAPPVVQQDAQEVFVEGQLRVDPAEVPLPMSSQPTSKPPRSIFTRRAKSPPREARHAAMKPPADSPADSPTEAPPKAATTSAEAAKADDALFEITGVDSPVNSWSDRLDKANTMLITTVVHLVILLLLALWIFPSDKPRDVLIMSQSNQDAEPFAEIEVQEISKDLTPQINPNEPVPLEALEVELDVTETMEAVTESPLKSSMEFIALNAVSQTESLNASKGEAGKNMVLFCGVHGYGQRVIYIVDRSSSMAGGRINLLKAEMIRSLQGMTKKQYYTIFAYNTMHVQMPTDPAYNEDRGLVSADGSLGMASYWIRALQAGGGTNPASAVVQALKLNPDVIFLLSDGEFSLTPELAVAIRKSGKEIPIHTIAFQTFGNLPSLVNIAKSTGGKYRRYVAQ